MLRAAQTKWIGRFMAKSSIQDALLLYEQQLRDAAMSFQVRSIPFTHTDRITNKNPRLARVIDRNTLRHRLYEERLLD